MSELPSGFIRTKSGLTLDVYGEPDVFDEPHKTRYVSFWTDQYKRQRATVPMGLIEAVVRYYR